MYRTTLLLWFETLRCNIDDVRYMLLSLLSLMQQVSLYGGWVAPNVAGGHGDSLSSLWQLL